MANINDLASILREIREIEKGVVPSTVSTDQGLAVLGVPAATTLRFSLPSRCYFVAFTATNSSIYGAPISTASGNFGLIVPNALKFNQFASGNFPLNLSDFAVWCGPAASGTTLVAFYQASAPLAS